MLRVFRRAGALLVLALTLPHIAIAQPGPRHVVRADKRIKKQVFAVDFYAKTGVAEVSDAHGGIETKGAGRFPSG